MTYPLAEVPPADSSMWKTKKSKIEKNYDILETEKLKIEKELVNLGAENERIKNELEVMKNKIKGNVQPKLFNLK